MKAELVDLDNVICNRHLLLAHRGNAKNETLLEHTQRCQKYNRAISDAKKLDKIIYNCIDDICYESVSVNVKNFIYGMFVNVATFHDSGKINPRFQRERMKNFDVGIQEFCGVAGSNHSLLSAVIFMDYYYMRLSKEIFDGTAMVIIKGFIIINAYIISRHHGDLTSIKQFVDEFTNNGTAYVILDEFLNDFRQQEQCRKLKHFINANRIINVVKNWDRFQDKLNETNKLSLTAYIRLVYSVLVASDYYATSEFECGYGLEPCNSNNQLRAFRSEYEESHLYKKIREYEKQTSSLLTNSQEYTEINDLRNSMFLEAEQCLNKNIDADLFFLEAPTGSGKSNIAMNLSLNLLTHGMDKIINVYPFNTLIEQNIENLANIFDKNSELFNRIAVINSLTPIKTDPDKEDCSNYYSKALLDRQFLDYPFILTSHVSLFNWLFGYHKEDLFGFHQLANSVLILDEIQSYRNSIWTEIIIFLKRYAHLLNMKVIIMSATLPDLDYLSNQDTDIVHLIQNKNKFFQSNIFKDRVIISYELLNDKIDFETLLEHVITSYDNSKKILVEFIRKVSAIQFFDLLKERISMVESTTNTALLIGDTNRIDRYKILDRAKKSSEGIILVATQVIEAGVDIDMDIGYKDISKLDSEEQFIGRINRSNKKKGLVYFFDMDEPQMIYHNDVRTNNELTLCNDKMKKIFMSKKFDDYYELVMKSIKNNFNILRNRKGLDYLFNETLSGFDFMELSERMKLIDDNKDEKLVFLNIDITLEDGKIISGCCVWNKYKRLLRNNSMEFSEKQIHLSRIKADMSYFLYSVNEKYITYYDDLVGETYYLNNGKKYLVDGRLDLKKMDTAFI